MLDLCFYTVFIGLDTNQSFQIPALPSEKYNCYYFTNNNKIINMLANTKWIPVYLEVIPADDTYDSCMKAKYLKVFPEHYAEINKYHYTCYLDSKLGKVSDAAVESLITEYCINSNKAMLLRRHWIVGPDVFEELQESMLQRRYVAHESQYRAYINRQIAAGLSSVTKDHYACGFIIRDMHNLVTRDINQDWYAHILECGIQDQISFFFVKQKYLDHLVPIDVSVFV
jgi:hypothetical protein